MDFLTVMEKYPDQAACITHLEKIRWNDAPKCPHCESHQVGRKNENKDEDKVGRVGHWNCIDCQASFKVICGTIFQGLQVLL